MIPIDLSGKIALVTGASGDLGKVMAVVLAQSGADVALHYNRNRGRAEKVGAEIAKLGRRFCLVTGDVADAASVNAMKESVVKELGAPDIIVTNAVIQYQWTKVLEQSPEDYRSQFESCVLQNVLMAQAFIPDMIARKRGRVIAINTECAMQCDPGQSAYVAGKRGMDGLLRVLAREVGEHGITVNQVAPGWMLSENRPASARPDSYREEIPLKKWGTDQDIANAVAFLASDLASYISGVYLPVCGGNVMPGI